MKKYIIITCLIVIGFILIRWIDSITGPPPDPFHGVPTDKGKVPADAGMACVEASTQLGETSYHAKIGASRRDGKRGPSWDYYFVWISKKASPEEDAWYPFYSRWMKSKRISSGLAEFRIEEVVSFNENTRTASFDCGFTNFVCVLPPE